MKEAKLIAELGALDLVSGWVVFTEMGTVPGYVELGIKVCVAVSVVTYNIVKTYKVLKSK